MNDQEKDIKFAARLKGLRIKLPMRKDEKHGGMRVVYQGEVADGAGISLTSYSKAERGFLVKEAVLYKIAKFYGVSVDYLKTGLSGHVAEETTPYNKGIEGGHKELNKSAIPMVNSPVPGYNKVSPPKDSITDILLMAAGVLESGTSYADALTLNIQHFDRAIRAEARILNLERECEDLKNRVEDLESKIKAPDGALKKSAEM